MSGLYYITILSISGISPKVLGVNELRYARDWRDIFQRKNQADTFLQASKRSDSYNTGVVCECCIHRCSYGEMLQYCSSSKSGRRKRSIFAGKEEEIMDEIYNEIAMKMKDYDGPLPTWEELIDDPVLQRLKEQKLANIASSEERKRVSGEMAEAAPIDKEKEVQLKDYMRSRLLKMFEMSEHNMNDGSKEKELESLLEKFLELMRE